MQLRDRGRFKPAEIIHILPLTQNETVQNKEFRVDAGAKTPLATSTLMLHYSY